MKVSKLVISIYIYLIYKYQLSCYLLPFYSKKTAQQRDVEELKKQSNLVKALKLFLTPLRIAVILLMVIGILFFVQVGIVLWGDIVFYGKDIELIFFESRIGQGMSLGLGLQLIHYYLLAILCISTGLAMFILGKK